MELTPIKIPGKRRRKGGAEHESTPAAVKQKTATRLSKRKARKPRPRGSYMERELPLEVLEQIFWYSQNINFPRAIPRIGVIMSDESTRRKTIIEAFGPTWEVWRGRRLNRSRHSRSHSDAPSRHQEFDHGGGSPTFQSHLLEYSWCNVDLLLQAYELWVQSNGLEKSPEDRRLWVHPLGPNIPTASGPLNSAKDRFLQDYKDALITVRPGRQPYAFDHVRDTWIEVHYDTRIPDYLLTGPWETTQLQKLFWLVRGGARLAEDQTWELMLPAFREAFHQGDSNNSHPNMLVLRLFHALDAFSDWPRHVVQEVKDEVVTWTKVNRSETASQEFSAIISWLLSHADDGSQTMDTVHPH